MRIKDLYKLELHWNGVDKNSDTTCVLYEAFFGGPVIKNAKKVSPKDNILIDFTPQYTKILTSYYFVRLQWENAYYVDNKINLPSAVLVGDFVNKISNLDSTDYIIIDTSKHEEKEHMYTLVYRGFVVNKNGKEYEYA